MTLFARICLAFAIAFVFTGRMEAAAAHCAKLAATEVAVAAPEPEAMPCHGMDEAAAPVGMDHHSPAPQAPGPDTCECIAVLKACSPIVTTAASARIEPYEWVRPEAAAFASIEPAPALKPPRA